MMQRNTLGALEMIAAMIISGTVGWFVLNSGQPATTVVFWRCALGALAMLGVCLYRGHRPTISRRAWLMIVVGGGALVLNWICLFSAYRYASIAIATVVYHTQPFMLVALGIVFFGERPGASRLSWLLLAFLGMAAITMANGAGYGSAGDYLLGIGLALATAFFYAITAALTKGLTSLAPQIIVLIQLSIGTLLLAPFANAPAEATAFSLTGSLPWLIPLGVIHTGLMSTLLYGAIQKIPTALVGALSFIYPLIAILVDWLAFGHRLSAVQVLGAAAILLAAAGMHFHDRFGQALARLTGRG